MILLAVFVVLFGVVLDAVSMAQTPWCTLIGVVLGAALLLS